MTMFGTLTKTGEVVDKIEVELNTVPSSDPLAFMYGVYKGQSYLGSQKNVRPINHDSLFRDLDPEYLRGFLYGFRNILVSEGTEFEKGQEQSYIHRDKAINKS